MNRILKINELKQKNKILKDVAKRVKKAKRIETACRDICLQSGINPDRLVCLLMPEYIHYPIPAHYVPDPQTTMPAWRMFYNVVCEAMDILEATK